MGWKAAGASQRGRAFPEPRAARRLRPLAVPCSPAAPLWPRLLDPGGSTVRGATGLLIQVAVRARQRGAGWCPARRCWVADSDRGGPPSRQPPAKQPGQERPASEQRRQGRLGVFHVATSPPVGSAFRFGSVDDLQARAAGRCVVVSTSAQTMPAIGGGRGRLRRRFQPAASSRIARRAPVSGQGSAVSAP